MSSNEPEFRDWRKRLLGKLAILCTLAIPVGLCLAGRVPVVFSLLTDLEVAGLVVAVLGLLGLIVSLVKMEKIK